jgi:hypothetical protein
VTPLPNTCALAYVSHCCPARSPTSALTSCSMTPTRCRAAPPQRDAPPWHASPLRLVALTAAPPCRPLLQCASHHPSIQIPTVPTGMPHCRLSAPPHGCRPARVRATMAGRAALGFYFVDAGPWNACVSKHF